jgi:hypothetical protein
MTVVEGVENVRLCLLIFLALSHVADYSPSALYDVVLEGMLKRSLLLASLFSVYILLRLCHLNTNYNPGSTKSF